MKCSMIVDRLIESDGDEDFPFLERLYLHAHLFFCPACAEAFRRYRQGRETLFRNAMPPAPGLSASIMAKLMKEEDVFDEDGLLQGGLDKGRAVPFLRWVVAGCVILVSLASAFFGITFERLSAIAGPYFILSMGITIGLIISIYGAIFIGSHLNELSERFRLH